MALATPQASCLESLLRICPGKWPEPQSDLQGGRGVGQLLWEQQMGSVGLLLSPKAL